MTQAKENKGTGGGVIGVISGENQKQNVLESKLAKRKTTNDDIESID